MPGLMIHPTSSGWHTLMACQLDFFGFVQQKMMSAQSFTMKLRPAFTGLTLGKRCRGKELGPGCWCGRSRLREMMVMSAALWILNQ